MCYCDIDEPTFYLAETRKARKLHRCCECKRLIQPGEQYERVAGKWPELDGGVITVKTCSECLKLREWAESAMDCFCCAHGELIDYVTEDVRGQAIYNPGYKFAAYRHLVKIRRAHTEAQQLEVAA